MKRAVIYCRVSTEDQEREGTSLRSQLEMCLKEANKLGYDVPQDKVLTEVWSGRDRERPDFTKLRQWIGNKDVDCVIFNSVDRLARDPVPLVLLAEDAEKSGVELRCLTEPFENTDTGRLILYILGYASKLEAERIRERTNRGWIKRAQDGRLPTGGGGKKYGYYYIKGTGEGRGIRVVNEEEAQWVRKMYEWIANGELRSVRSVTLRLRALEVPRPAGDTFWNRSMVHRILTDLAYTGKTYSFTVTREESSKPRKLNARKKKGHRIARPESEWVEVKNGTPAIVSEELFEIVQERLKKNKELASRNNRTQSKYLLSGYLYCGKCRKKFWSWAVNVKRGDKSYFWRRYRCSGKNKIVTPVQCENRSYSADWLEQIVWKEIETVLFNPEMVLSELKKRQEETISINLIEKDFDRVNVQLKHLKKQKQRIWTAFGITGDEDTFKENITVLEEDIKILQEEKLNLENKIEITRKVQLDMQGIKRACELVKYNLKEATFEDKRLALEALQIKVWVDGETIEIQGAIPIKHDVIVSDACQKAMLYC